MQQIADSMQQIAEARQMIENQNPIWYKIITGHTNDCIKIKTARDVENMQT